MRKISLNCKWLCILMAVAGTAFTFQSCNVDDLNPFEGTEENFVIKNKNYGSLKVNEKYADCAATYEIANNPYGISSIIFTAIGTYYMEYSYGDYGKSYSDTSAYFDVEFEGNKVSVPINAGLKKSTKGYKSETSGTYTYKDGKYILTGDKYTLEGNQLTVTENGQTRTYTAAKVTESNKDALTQRLCHTWNVSKVLLKLYNDGNLIFTYRLSDEEMDEYIVDDIYFAPLSSKGSGAFVRHKSGEENGIGSWWWNSQKDQTLFYEFSRLSSTDPTPVIGSNDLTVYFSDNRLYMTERPTIDMDETVEWNGKEIKLEAMWLYQMDVKGN